MNPETIQTEQGYLVALARLEEIFDAIPGTSAGDELASLAELIEDYEDRLFPVPAPSPEEAAQFREEQTAA